MTAHSGNARSGETEVVVIIKAAPQVGARHGETVCCAGIDLYGRWLRLFPIAFRNLEDGQKFGRWDRIRFRWRLPTDDNRIESRRIDQQSIEIVGQLRPNERSRFLAKCVTTSLDAERVAGRSLALLKPRELRFKVEEKTQAELAQEQERFDALRSQPDLFNGQQLVPYAACPYRFKYSYTTEDGAREGTCQDWEMEATYYKWSRRYGRERALNAMRRIFGEVLPKRGVLLAMGTHSRWPDTWLINGVIRYDEANQLVLL